MRKGNRILRASHSRGLTLIELLVSITIGLILMIAVTSTYLGTATASKMAEATGRMNEDAQAALSILAQQIRMAGDNPRHGLYDTTTPHNAVFAAPIDSLGLGSLTYAIRGCDGKFSDVTSAADINSLTCAAGDNPNPDSLAVSYEATPTNTVATAAGVATDCLGQGLTTITNASGSAKPTKVWNGVATVATNVTYTIADNRFYLDTVNTVPSLYCKGNGNATPQPMVENIEDLQFFWGLAAPTGTNMTVAGYLNDLFSANKVESDANLAALPDSPSRWARVVAVRICVLVRSEQPLVSDLSSARYVKCDGSTEPNPPDLRMRRAYFSVVALRNRIQQ
jgi:type IV pilus assembly protein PilW